MKAVRSTLKEIAIKDATQEITAPEMDVILNSVFRDMRIPEHIPDLKDEYRRHALLIKALLYRQTIVLEALLNHERRVNFGKNAQLH